MRDPAEVGHLAPGPANAEATDWQTISVWPVRTKTDIEAAVNLIEQFHGESIYQQAPFVEDRVRRNARRFRDDTDRRLAALAWLQERPIGLIAGAVEPLIFADMKQASIAILYVASEGRGSHAAIKLERWFTEQARRVGRAGHRAARHQRPAPQPNPTTGPAPWLPTYRRQLSEMTPAQTAI